MKHIEYLKERLNIALEEVEIYSKKIREEEKRTTKFEVRVVIETKGLDWRRMTISHHELTLEGRDRLIGNLAWLRTIEK